VLPSVGEKIPNFAFAGVVLSQSTFHPVLILSFLCVH